MAVRTKKSEPGTPVSKPKSKFGRRYRLFPEGDVFVGVIEGEALDRISLCFHPPVPATDGETPPPEKAVEFSKIKEAERWVKRNGVDLQDKKVVVLTVNRIFDVAVEQQPKVTVRQKPRQVEAMAAP